jgi:predicted nucleic acid-binding protein
MSPHSIDAIHLATALGSDLARIVTYDEQLRAVAMTRRAS